MSYFDWEHVEDGVRSRQQGYVTSRTVDDALAWIATAEEPWLSWVAFHAGHKPWHVPPEHLHGYGPDLGDDPPLQMRAMIEAMDREIGRLVAGLPAAQRDRTYVVVVGDNGTTERAGLGEFATSGKSTVNEHGVRVPLIV